MTDTSDPSDSPPQTRRYTARGETEAVLRQPDDQDGVFDVRLPIATTGDVRNKGDDPLTREELRGMAEQIENRAVGVFGDHGNTALGGMAKYTAIEKLGEWVDPELREREDGETELVATARMMDPETLPAATGQLREYLAAIREQVKRGMSLSSSIGWRDDESYPGGVDLMEASIVGIGADPRTTSQSAEAALVARAAVDAGLDADALIDSVRSAVADISARDPDTETDSDATERGEYEVGDETIDITPPEYMVNAAQAALDAEQRDDVTGDCGTGVGTERANQIVTDSVGPEVIDEVAAYLTSHEEDVTAEGGVSEWTAEEWSDCGNRQYAKWGGDGSGRALDWAQGKANEVADALDEDLPYDRATDADTNTDTDMSDADTADDGGTTDGEQTATDDGGDTTRQLSEDDVRELVDMTEDLVMSHIEMAMDDLEAEMMAMVDGEEPDEENESDEDDEDDDGEDDDDMNTSGADGDDADSETEEERDADDGTDVSERVAELEAELAEIRSGGLSGDDVDTGDDPETDADDGETRDSDASDDDEPETPDLRSQLFG